MRISLFPISLPPHNRRPLLRLLPALFLMFVFGGVSSCSEKPAPAPEETAATDIEFTTNITGHGKTRAADSQWAEEDLIGTYMFDSGSESELAANHKYVTAGSNVFTAFSPADRLRVEEGDLVDFIAYYPYTDQLDGYIYNVDITRQAVQDDIDLLYSSNAKNIDPWSGRPNLSFDHMLSKIVLNITNSGQGSLSDLRVTVRGMNTEGKFDLLTGDLHQNDLSVADFDMALSTTLEGRRAEAIVMPAGDVSGIEFLFTLGQETFRWKYPADKTVEKGTRYTYSVTLNSAAPPAVEPEYGWIELPVSPDIENTMTVTHFFPTRTTAAGGAERNHTLLYDTKYKISYWVAYPLTAGHMGDSGRTNGWNYDPQVDASYQVNCIARSYNQDYGCDRGHQLPSADRTYSVEENYTTFYMTNITPQNSILNQQAWEKLEELVRSWAKQTDTLYVVTGAALPKNENSIVWVPDQSTSQTSAAKPKYYYKALAKKVGDEYYTVGYKYDNVSTPNSVDHLNYRVTVAELEQMTGFTFFPSLPDGAKSTIDASQWQ